jgi:hypothetical protein
VPGLLEGGRQAPELGVALDQAHRRAPSRARIAAAAATGPSTRSPRGESV